MNSFLTSECGIDAQAPVLTEEQVHPILLIMPICTLLIALCNPWKECQDKLGHAAPVQRFTEASVSIYLTPGLRC